MGLPIILWALLPSSLVGGGLAERTRVQRRQALLELQYGAASAVPAAPSDGAGDTGHWEAATQNGESSLLDLSLQVEAGRGELWHAEKFTHDAPEPTPINAPQREDAMRLPGGSKPPPELDRQDPASSPPRPVKRPKPRLAEEDTLKNQIVEKQSSSGKGWAKAQLRLVKEPNNMGGQSFLLVQNDPASGKLHHLFDLCQDDVSVKMANDISLGAFRVVADRNHNFNTYVYKCITTSDYAGDSAMVTQVAAKSWVKQLEAVLEQCVPGDGDSSESIPSRSVSKGAGVSSGNDSPSRAPALPDPSRVPGPAPAGRLDWQVLAEQELRKVFCHANNLKRWVNRNLEVAKFAGAPSNGSRPQLSTNEMKSSLLSAKRAVRAARDNMGPVAHELMKVASGATSSRVTRYTDYDCRDEKDLTGTWVVVPESAKTQTRTAASPPADKAVSKEIHEKEIKALKARIASLQSLNSELRVSLGEEQSKGRSFADDLAKQKAKYNDVLNILNEARGELDRASEINIKLREDLLNCERGVPRQSGGRSVAKASGSKRSDDEGGPSRSTNMALDPDSDSDDDASVRVDDDEASDESSGAGSDDGSDADSDSDADESSTASSDSDSDGDSDESSTGSPVTNKAPPPLPPGSRVNKAAPPAPPGRGKAAPAGPSNKAAPPGGGNNKAAPPARGPSNKAAPPGRGSNKAAPPARGPSTKAAPPGGGRNKAAPPTRSNKAALPSTPGRKMPPPPASPPLRKPPNGVIPGPPGQKGPGGDASGKRKPRMVQDTENALSELLQLAKGSIHEPVGEQHAKEVIGLIEVDRDRHIRGEEESKKREERQRMASNTTKKLEKYEFPWIGEKIVGWELLFREVEKGIKIAGYPSLEKILPAFFADELDVKIVGDLSVLTPPYVLIKMIAFLNQLGEDALELAGADPMLELQKSAPEEFAKLFSGVKPMTETLLSLAPYEEKQLKERLVCLSSRFTMKEEIGTLPEATQDALDFYSTDAPKRLAAVVDGVVVGEAKTFQGELTREDFDKKNIKVKQEWGLIQRSIADRSMASIEQPSKWLPAGVSNTLVPWMYLKNVLLETSEYMVGKQFKSVDNGKWSPTHFDLFLAYANANGPKGGEKNYFEEALSSCMALKRFGKVEEGIGVNILKVREMLDNIGRCGNRVQQLQTEWDSLKAQASEALKKLQHVQELAADAAGPLVAKLAPDSVEIKGNRGMEALKQLAVDWAESQVTPDPSKVGKPVPAQGALDDKTVRETWIDFCSLLRAKRDTIGTYYHEGNAPKSASGGSPAGG